jgi:hypothetical protein
MDAAIQLLVAVAFVSALVFLFQSIFVLHMYEKENNKWPPSIQWWPFNSEMKAAYPEQSRVGRVLVVVSLISMLPWLIGWFQGGG